MVVALIVVMLAMSVAPAFAGANGRASCQGAAHSDQTEPGAAGSHHSFVAQQEPMVNGQVASFHTGLGPQEQDRNVDGQLRSEEHTSELQSRQYLVCRLLLEKKKYTKKNSI